MYLVTIPPILSLLKRVDLRCNKLSGLAKTTVADQVLEYHGFDLHTLLANNPNYESASCTMSRLAC